MLTVEHLTCGYGGEPVIRGLSFQVERGQCLCILGPNGCGKTTLLRALVGLLPSEGQICVDGARVGELNARQRARSLGLMSQLSSSYFAFTVYETVLLGRYAHRRGPLASLTEEDRRLVRQSMEMVGLTGLEDRPITELSGGQLQRVFLARTFAQDPKVLLLDEPTNHLDLKVQLELTDTLRRWVSAGDRCVVGVLHDVNLALSFADTVLLLERGEAVAFDRADRLDLRLVDRVYRTDVGAYMRGSLSRWTGRE